MDIRKLLAGILNKGARKQSVRHVVPIPIKNPLVADDPIARVAEIRAADDSALVPATDDNIKKLLTGLTATSIISRDLFTENTFGDFKVELRRKTPQEYLTRHYGIDLIAWCGQKQNATPEAIAKVQLAFCHAFEQISSQPSGPAK